MTESDTPEATAAYPFLGSRISLITRSDIRYQGTLFTIDPGNSTVALSNVRCFGTEDRRPDTVPPSDAVFPFIIFKGADIKNLIVCAEQDEPSEQLPPPPDDPAIVATSSPSPNAAVLAAANFKQQAQADQVESTEQPLVFQMQKMSMNQASGPPPASVNAYSPMPPSAFGAYESGYQPQGMWYPPHPPPDAAFAAHTARNTSSAMYPSSAYAPPYYRPQPQPNMQPQYQSQPSPNMQPQYQSQLSPNMQPQYQSQLSPNMQPQHYPPPPPVRMQQYTQQVPKLRLKEQRQPQQNMQSQYPSQPPMNMQHAYYSTTALQNPSSPEQEPLPSIPLPSGATSQLNPSRDNAFARSQHEPRPSHFDERQSNIPMGPRSSYTEEVDKAVPDSEFDFQSSNARFDKASFARNLMSPVFGAQSNVSERSNEDSGEAAAACIPDSSTPKYNKASSFFDDISLDRDERGRRDNSRRGQNQETFGKLATNYMAQSYQRSRARTRRSHPNPDPKFDTRAHPHQRASRSMQPDTPNTAVRRSDNRPPRIDGNPRSDGRRNRLRRGRNQPNLTDVSDTPNMASSNAGSARTRQSANKPASEKHPPKSPSHRS